MIGLKEIKMYMSDGEFMFLTILSIVDIFILIIMFGR